MAKAQVNGGGGNNATLLGGAPGEVGEVNGSTYGK